MPAGTFKILVHSDSYGFASIAPETVTVAFPADPTIAATPITTSFVGGKQFVLAGSGFVTINPSNN